MKTWFSLLLIAAWLPFAASLWPYPSEENAKQFSAAWASIAKQNEPARRFMDEDIVKEMDIGISRITDPQIVLKEWRAVWIDHAIVLLLGIGSIVLAFRRTMGWKVGIMLASLSYLVLAHGFQYQKAIQWDQWKMWWMMATEYPQWGAGAVYREIVFPLIHVILIAVFSALSAIAIWNRNKTTEK